MDYRQPFHPISKLHIQGQRIITINLAEIYHWAQKGSRVPFLLLCMAPERNLLRRRLLLELPMGYR
jgi:hypothetical protein